MKRTVIGLCGAAVMALSGQAMASEALAKANNCMGCHAIDKKMVGPSYKEVAAKYKGQGDAEAKLVKKVKEGGVGVWGQVPMPPNPAVKDDDIKAIVKWILTL